MSLATGIVLSMELIYLSLGLLIGAVVGALVAALRFRSKGSDSSLAIQLASAEATVTGSMPPCFEQKKIGSSAKQESVRNPD